MPSPGTRASRSAVADDTRERILLGAASAFGKLGYAETRVEDILLAAEVSRPTFYKAFESKDDVFEELSARHHRTIQERIVASLAGVEDPLRQIEAIACAFMRWRAELGPIGRVLDQEARTPGTRIARHRRTTLAAMSKLGAERFSKAERGEVDPTLYYGLIAALEGIADALLTKPPVRDAVIERATRNAVRILAGSLAREGDPLPPLPPLPTSSEQ